MIVILMGVTGSGKTTIGRLLAAATGWHFAEGDDYHSEANRQKMHAGIPLNDEDRAPWLAALHQVLMDWLAQGESGILACSALKEFYRNTLAAGLPSSAYRLVLLDPPREVLEDRLAHREGHYMNPHLLQSQLDTLEPPVEALFVPSSQPAAVIVSQILEQLG